MTIEKKKLSRRERQVFIALALGATMREICEQLVIGMKTAGTHRGHVLQKLAARNNAELVRLALRAEEIHIDDMLVTSWSRIVALSNSPTMEQQRECSPRFAGDTP